MPHTARHEGSRIVPPSWPRRRATPILPRMRPSPSLGSSVAPLEPPTSSTLRVLVADADPAALDRLRLLLDAQPDVVLVAECATGVEAAERAHALAPDLLLLDAPTADLDLAAIARGATLPARPMVVLMGERRDHAARGFEIEAVDYLLKPISGTRLSTALRRAHGHRRLVELAERHRALVAMLAAAPQGPLPHAITALAERDPAPEATGATGAIQHLLIKTGRRMYLVPVHEVTRFEAYGNYVRVFARGQAHLVRETMDRLETRLDPHAFVRVHRTCIVRIACIRELQTSTPGAYGVVLADGTKVRMSRLYRAKFRERFAAP